MLPDAVQSADVNVLAEAVAAQVKQVERDTFPVALAPVKRAPPPLRVQIENVADSALRAAADDAVIRALRRAGYTVNAADAKAWSLRFRFDRAQMTAGVDRGVWDIRLQRADGTLAGRAEDSSSLADQLGASTMGAFAEAATVSQLRALGDWLRDEPPPVAKQAVDASTPPMVAQPAPSAEPSARETAIRAAATAWAQAWSAKDLERYLASYAPEFKPPDGQTRGAWGKMRRARISGPRSIEVSITDVEVVQRDDDRAAATFRQDYRSDGYEDSVRKTLELVRDGERWLIAEERVVSKSAETSAARGTAPARVATVETSPERAPEAASAAPATPAPAPVADAETAPVLAPETARAEVTTAPAPAAAADTSPMRAPEAASAEAATPAPAPAPEAPSVRAPAAAADTSPMRAPEAVSAEAATPASAPAHVPATDAPALLGDLRVLSKLGRPLRAEIEIISLPSAGDAPVVVRLASAETFRRAGKDFHPALNGVSMTFEPRAGKPIIALTTRLPMNQLVLNLLVEVEWGSRLFVREYAIVLDPPTHHRPRPSHAVLRPTPFPAQAACAPLLAAAAPLLMPNSLREADACAEVA